MFYEYSNILIDFTKFLAKCQHVHRYNETPDEMRYE